MKTRVILPMTEGDVSRFWSRVRITANPDKCWDWIGFTHRGYGRFSIGPVEKFIAPRVSYFINHKVDPMEMCVLHKCDNPKCVNPNHLFLGTNKDNSQDMVRKGRINRKGTRNQGQFKLSEEKVMEIKKKYKHGMGQLLAKEYGVCRQLITDIAAGKRWSHVNNISSQLIENQ